MQNTYEYKVRAQCPVNPNDRDVYQFTIYSRSIIEVERIVEFFNRHAGDKEVFQEALTQKCAVTLGANVRSEGIHSGVKVICVAP